jgi:predicted  nucleic acid-binding Zn-ribbon protein
MSRVSPLFLAILLVGSAGMYGCTQQKSAASAKLHDMETRYAKLEEDYRTISATNDANRKKLSQLEARTAELSKQLEALRTAAQERDVLRKECGELRKQVTTRTAERDAVQGQLVQFRQDLQSIVTRVDAAISSTAPPSGAVSVVPASRTSP